MANRISTGITDKTGKVTLDKMLGGGIPKGSVVLVTGAPGTAKSILCYQIMGENAKKGKKCLYVAFDQTKDDVLSQAKSLGIDLAGKNCTLLTYEQLNDLAIDALIDQISKTKQDLVILDSLASISGIIPPEEFNKISQAKIIDNYFPIPQNETRIIRQAIRRLILAFKKANTTALLINELPEGTQELSKDGESDFLTDGIIVMHYVEIGVADFRTMSIRKMRQTDHEKDLIPFIVGKNGIELTEKK